MPKGKYLKTESHRKKRMKKIAYILIVIGVCLVINCLLNQEKTINDLRDELEFYQRKTRQIIYQDVGHVRKVYDFTLSQSAMIGSDKQVLYMMSFERPFIVEVGYELCVDFNQYFYGEAGQ